MKRFLALGILLAFLATGLVFGQEQQQQKQEQGQSIVFQLFGVSCIPYAGQVIKAFDDSGVVLYRLFVRDVKGVAGSAEIIVLAKKDSSKFIILCGWLNSWRSDEIGFARVESDATLTLSGPWFMTKSKEDGEQLEDLWENQDPDNIILTLSLLTTKYDDATKQETTDRKEIKRFDIRKFIEENFKDK